MAVGTGLDARIRMLMATVPAVTTMPDPPPWDPLSLWGFPAGYLKGVAAKKYSGPVSTRRELLGQPNVTSDGRLLPLFWKPADPVLVAQLDELTALAIERLLPMFAGVPQEQRYAHRQGLSDLIIGGCLIDIKCWNGRGPRWEQWLDQLLKYLLFDFEDAYQISELGSYLARRGVLVRWPLDEVLAHAIHPLGQMRAGMRRLLHRLEATTIKREPEPMAAALGRVGLALPCKAATSRGCLTGGVWRDERGQLGSVTVPTSASLIRHASRQPYWTGTVVAEHQSRESALAALADAKTRDSSHSYTLALIPELAPLG
jgi:hypothetical protein